MLFKSLFTGGVQPLKEASLSQGISETEWNQMLVYSAAVFQNCGNYLSFGDTKFVPQLPKESFLKIVKASPGYAAN